MIASEAKRGNEVIDRFLKYSLEREKKICAVLMQDGAMKKVNLIVTAIDEDGSGFSARLAGRKKDMHVDCANVLTCAYARGDQGELE